MVVSDKPSSPRPPTIGLTAGMMLIGSLLAAEAVQSWLSSQALSEQFVSPATWVRLASWLTGQPADLRAGSAEVPFSSILMLAAGLHLGTWLAGSLALMALTGRGASSFRSWGFNGGLWWAALGLWDWIAVGLQMAGAEQLVSIWGLFSAFWAAACLAGWMTTWLVIAHDQWSANRQAIVGASFAKFHGALWGMVAAYAVVFVTMNWRLYFNLLIPHGDSAMYEEHLWNLLHGKGFRSYLDQGLFFGEHIQFVHLGLIPLYILWPSHLLLELCESLALALGAWPVYWMTRRHTQSHTAGLAAAAAYLLYPPMQFLDIEIDLKTFRPEAFGIPILLLTLDQLDRRHLWGALIGVLGCLTVKEDYAIVLAPLGLWIAAVEGGIRKAEGGRDRRWLVFGALLMIGSVIYLYLATRVIMPYFRSGAEIHYAKYFSKFGETPEQIVMTMLTRPGMVFGEFFRVSTALYALMLLVPVAFIPLLSPSRFAVGLPLFGVLCLNEVARDPRHQFHAPLVAIVFWSLAGGWNQAVRLIGRLSSSGPLAPASGERVRERGRVFPETPVSPIPSVITHAVWTSSLAMGLFFSLHPGSLTFWDPGSEWYWRKLYGPSRRAEEFAKIAGLIPPTARVASTDFVHPRYTHFERSYDYSGYRRKVSDYEDRVPDDTDYIVIDTQHRYSETKAPGDVPELREHPEEWELIPDKTDGYFIVLKRKRPE